MSEFTKMSVKQLKDYCRNNRIKGYSTLKKSELIVLVKKVNRKSNLVKKSRKPSRKPKKTSRKPKKTSRKPKKTSRKPKKTSRKPMKSQMSDRLNKSQKEYLKKLEKAINEVSKMSKKTSRKPKKTSRKPKKTSRKPKKTSRKPKKTSRKPKKTSRKPKKTSRKPKKTSRKPVKTSRKPKKVRKYKARTKKQSAQHSLIRPTKPLPLWATRTGPRRAQCHKVTEGETNLKWETFLKYYHTPINVINTIRGPYEKLECLSRGSNKPVGKLYLHHVNGDFCCGNAEPTIKEPQNWIMKVGIPMLKRDMQTCDVETVKRWMDDGRRPDDELLQKVNKFATFDYKYLIMRDYAIKLDIYTEFKNATNEFNMTQDFIHIINNYIRYH